MLVTASEQVGCDELPCMDGLRLDEESSKGRLPSPRGEEPAAGWAACLPPVLGRSLVGCRCPARSGCTCTGPAASRTALTLWQGLGEHDRPGLQASTFKGYEGGHRP